jgi:dihydrofolate reductase
MIAMIAAMDKHGVIGFHNRLPWRLPEDLAHFRELTMGQTVVMGRKTMESLDKPLSGRRNLVLTRSLDQTPTGFSMIRSIDQVRHIAEDQTVFVIGGESIYLLFLPYADVIYLTVIDAIFRGDAFFPKIDTKEWQIISETEGKTDQENPYRYIFRVYRRTLLHIKEC